MSRYREEPQDLVDRVLALERRLTTLENNPQTGNTTIDTGTLKIKDATGSVRVQIGLLSDGTYGIEVKETGQDIFHQVPYIFSSTIDTFQSTTSVSFTDLATVGPVQLVPIRSTGRVLVMVSSQVQWPSNAYSSGPVTQGGYVTISASGANTITTAQGSVKLLPMHLWSWGLSGGIQFSNTSTMMSTSAAVFSGLNAGDTTFTVKYSSPGGGTTEFGRRNLTIFAL